MNGWVGGAAIGVVVGGAAWGAGAGLAARGLVHRHRFAPLALTLLALGLAAAMMGLATVGLAAGWDGVIRDGEVRETVAAMVGTAAGEAMLVATLVTVGLDLAMRAPAWSAWLLAPLVGVGGVAASVVWSALLSTVAGQTPDQPGVDFLASNRYDEARFVATAFVLVGAPVLEELLFRGALHGALARRWGALPAILLGGASFGLLHASDPLVVPALTVFGVLLGALRQRSGSVFPGMLAHAVNNGIALLALRAAG